MKRMSELARWRQRVGLSVAECLKLLGSRGKDRRLFYEAGTARASGRRAAHAEALTRLSADDARRLLSVIDGRYRSIRAPYEAPSVRRGCCMRCMRGLRCTRRGRRVHTVLAPCVVVEWQWLRQERRVRRLLEVCWL